MVNVAILIAVICMLGTAWGSRETEDSWGMGQGRATVETDGSGLWTAPNLSKCLLNLGNIA